MDIIEIITWGVFAVVMVGSWVLKGIKHQNEKRNSQQMSIRRSAEMPQMQTRAVSSEELAAKRRRQLQELAQRRRAAKSGVGPQPTAKKEPSNLTMGQRAERAKAQAQYRARAEALKQKQAQEAALAQRKAKAQQAQAQRQQQARAQSQRSRQIQQQRAKAAAAAQRRAALPSKQRSHKDAKRIEAEHRQGVVHRHVPDSTANAYAEKTARAPGKRMRSLREAVVFKEIIDPPLALRQDQTA